MLALAQPAEAKIVYTPANKVIPVCSHHPKLCFKLDLNHDKIVDFTIPRLTYVGSYLLAIRPAAKQSKNQIWGTVSDPFHTSKYKWSVASALNSWVAVGPNSVKFQPKHSALLGLQFHCGPYSSGCMWGQWYNANSKYLGLRFYAKGKVHYGWARLNVPTPSGSHAKLTGYAYETIPNKPIITGQTSAPDVITLEPGSLGRLAQGAAGRLRK